MREFVPSGTSITTDAQKDPVCYWAGGGAGNGHPLLQHGNGTTLAPSQSGATGGVLTICFGTRFSIQEKAPTP